MSQQSLILESSRHLASKPALKNRQAVHQKLHQAKIELQTSSEKQFASVKPYLADFPAPGQAKNSRNSAQRLTSRQAKSQNKFATSAGSERAADPNQMQTQRVPTQQNNCQSSHFGSSGCRQLNLNSQRQYGTATDLNAGPTDAWISGGPLQALADRVSDSAYRESQTKNPSTARKSAEQLAATVDSLQAAVRKLQSEKEATEALVAELRHSLNTAQKESVVLKVQHFASQTQLEAAKQEAVRLRLAVEELSSRKECADEECKRKVRQLEEELAYNRQSFEDEARLLNDQNQELFMKNEDLVDLIKILDEKMSKFEQYILDHVENGEEELHKLIHTSVKQSLADDVPGDHSIQYTSLSLQISVMTHRRSHDSKASVDVFEQLREID